MEDDFPTSSQASLEPPKVPIPPVTGTGAKEDLRAKVELMHVIEKLKVREDSSWDIGSGRFGEGSSAVSTTFLVLKVHLLTDPKEDWMGQGRRQGTRKVCLPSSPSII